MGRDGLAAYNEEGVKIWSAHDYGIIDCYALNVVSSREVYFYYYDDFFLVQLDGMKEVNRYHVQGGNKLDAFIFAGKSLIVRVDMNTVMRFKIRNRTIVPDGKLGF